MSASTAHSWTAGERLVALMAGAASLLLLTATLTTGLASTMAGHGWHAPSHADAPAVIRQWPRHALHPREAYPAELQPLLPGPVLMWTALSLTLALLAGLGIAGWRLSRPLRTGLAGGANDPATSSKGLASHRDLRQHLSDSAVRGRAAQVRPSLAGTGRYPTRALGLALGSDLSTGMQLWGSVEDSYLVLGPPRSGKGVHLVIPHTLDASGPVLVTSTRPDTFHATHTARSQQGPVLTFDPQQLAPDAPRLRWSPTRGCEDPLIAINRARALSAGTGLNQADSGGDYWQQMICAVLRSYLHAAALTGRSVREILAWASRPTDPTPIRILKTETGAAPGWAEELAAQSAADPRQRDGVWSGIRRAVDSLADPRVLDTCSPTRDDAFDPSSFLRNHGTLYLLGTTGAQLSVAPLITALLEDLLDTARTLAAGASHGRLDPPLLLLLDEAANIAPIPTLPNLLADGGGTGITTVVVLQSLAQARSRWGTSGADAMWDAATTKVVLGGLAHADDLQRISRLAGEIDLPHLTRNHGSGGAGHSLTTRRLPALPLERIRCLPAGQALVLARRCPPAQVRLTPWWQHPSQSKNAIRAGRRSSA
ncbi:MAG: TraM recognition domain-containing protein [Mycobacteriales bacterium]|nr:TraM recognition domain-containing protein [Mycobacteriales bacterium]